MKIDCESRRVVIAEKEINLTAKEFDLLELLATNPGKVYSRENLLNIVWGYEYPGDARTVECTYPEAAGEDRAESQRAKICAVQVGRRILLSTVAGVSMKKNIFSK